MMDFVALLLYYNWKEKRGRNRSGMRLVKVCMITLQQWDWKSLQIILGILSGGGGEVPGVAYYYHHIIHKIRVKQEEVLLLH